jgi:hypothetical protein
MIRKIKILCLIILGLTTLYTIAGFFGIPMVLEKILPQKLSEALKRPVAVTNIRLNPFKLSFAAEGFEMKDHNGADPFVSFDRLFVDIGWESIFKKGLVLQAFLLEKPSVSIARLSSKEFNFSDLTAGGAPDEEKPGLPLRFEVSNIRITDGSFLFWDAPLNKKHVVSPINFELPFISNFDTYHDTFSEPHIEAKIDEAGVSVKIETKPFHDTLETIVHVNLTGVTLGDYFDYAPPDMGFKIARGRMDIRTDISFIRQDPEPILTIDGAADIHELEIADLNGMAVLQAPLIKIDMAPSHLLDPQMKITSVSVESARLFVHRDPDGKINLLSLGPPPREDQPPPEQTPPPADDSKKPFQLEVEDISLKGCAVVFADQSVLHDDGQPVETMLDAIDARLTGFSLAPDARTGFDFSSRLNGEAPVSLRGDACISPVSVGADFGVENFSLRWLEPYIPDNILLTIIDGRFSTSGRADIKAMPEQGMAASVKGAASVRQFALRETNKPHNLVSWDAFDLEDVDFEYTPMKIDIGRVFVNKFSHWLAIENDGKLNVQKAVEAPAPAPGKGETAGEKKAQDPSGEKAVPVHIAKIELKDCRLGFTDKTIEPDFSARLNLSEARISGLATQGSKSAKVYAKGKIDDYAPVEIKGDVNPLGDDLFMDLTLDLSNLELSPFSPYTGKYIGRTIEKGKLNIEATDRIEQKKIHGRIRLMLDQFTLGKDVDSPDALDLPVGLAVSLLKDRSGKIDLDIPVTGRTDDPEYKPGGLVWKAVNNIITKAATSPFDLVASIAGGGEELKFIEFEPAMAQPDEENMKKLQAVTTLMFERPGLMIDLSGFADTVRDRQAMAEMIFDKKIKELKYDDLSKKEKAATTAGQVSLTSEEYEEYLEELYEADVWSRPDKGADVKKAGDKALTTDEMKSRIIGQVKIDDNQLRDLAVERTQFVKNDILKDGRVEAKRIFIKEGGLATPQAGDSHRAGRVELSIK